VDRRCPVCFFLGGGGLVSIFGSNAHPMTSYAARISMLFNLGDWDASGDILVRRVLQESLSDHIAKFLCSPYERNYNLINSALHQYHPNALHQLLYCILRLINYNKPTTFIHQKCGRSIEYQFLNVQHDPCTSIPHEPATRSTPACLTSTITLAIQHI